MKRRSVRLVVAACAMMVSGVVWADWNPGDPYKMHYPQLPDPFGWDVDFTSPKRLADDWLCTQSGPVTDVHLWLSSYHDSTFVITNVQLRIRADIPAGVTTNYSHPGALLWSQDFKPFQFTLVSYGSGNQGWYDPNTGMWMVDDHDTYWQLNITDITNAFYQTNGVIYWLEVSIGLQSGLVGWKTSLTNWNDAAVYGQQGAPPGLPPGSPLYDPRPGHPGEQLDLAFVIVPEPTTFLLVFLSGLGLLAVYRSRRAT
jgi:hypothetical protein